MPPLKWINGTLPNGKFVRQAAKTRSWETAERKARLMEAQADPLQNAFVSRTAPSSDFETGKFEGRVLHVDSGRELEFRSVKELVMFVSEMHDAQPRKGCRALRTRKVQKQPPTHIQLKDR